MKPYWQDSLTTLWHGDARKIPEADGVAQTCVTSPPYWGLRDYKLEPSVWGGDPECRHDWIKCETEEKTGGGTNKGNAGSFVSGGACGACGAWLGCLGLEPTPEMYVANIVTVFREVWRVLKDDGTLWLNLGDSYSSGGRGGYDQTARRRPMEPGAGREDHPSAGMKRPDAGLKPKDLVGIPWAAAKALRDPYYAGRMSNERDRVWIAATLDAEGTICGFYHQRPEHTETHRSIRTGVHITLTNTSTLMLDEAQRIWPASRSEHQRHGEGHLGKLDSFRWIVHNISNKMMFLREIYPYLIVKKRQALIAYNLLLFMQDAKHLGKTAERFDVWEKRKRLTEILSDLNQQRSVDIPDWCVAPPSVLEPGWYLRQDIIWEKPNAMPESVTDRCTKSHEHIFMLSKNAKYFYDHEAIKEPGSGCSGGAAFGKVKQDGPGARRIAPEYNARIRGRDKQRGHSRRHEGFNDRWDAMEREGQIGGMVNKRDVWSVPVAGYPGAHFATFPPALIEPCILAGSRRGDVVIDPFNGSGTSGVVARKHGRKYIGVEANAEYLQLTHDRFAGPLFRLDTPNISATVTSA